MNYLTRYYKNLSEQLQEQVNNLERQILTEAPRRGGRQAIMPGSMPNIMQQLQIPEMPSASAPQTIVPSGGMENVGRNLSYIPPQMAPNFVQPNNNPQQPQPFSVVNAGPGVRQGIPGVNVEGPAVPQYVPPQMAPNYVQPGNNPAQPQQWSVATAGKGTTPNQFAQMAGGISKALDDVRRGMPSQLPQGQQQQQAAQATGQKGNFAQLSGSPIIQALSNIRQGKLPNEVSRDQDIADYLKGAGQQSGTRMTQTTIPAGDPNNPATYMPGNVQTSKRPSPAEFNQAAMEPGGVYQMDKSGYVQSYLPAQQQNVAPTRVKQQPTQQQSDNYQPVTGEYWKSPTERVVPGQQQPAQQPAQQPNQQASQQSTRDAMAQYGAQQFAQNATNLAFGGIFNNPQQQQQQAQQKPAQQQQPSPSTPFFQRAGETPEEIQQYQQQNQIWGPFGLRGQSPQEMEDYNRQVNSRRK